MKLHRVLPKVISVKLDNSASKRVLTAMKDDLRDEIVTKIEEGYLHAQKKKRVDPLFLVWLVMVVAVSLLSFLSFVVLFLVVHGLHALF